jgi:AcrR family transcriptional regulator
MTVRAESSPRRRRRTPEAAQREIIEAAEGLLRERPFRELTVDEVMRRTELSRPSFYVYFRDRHELVLRVVQHLFQDFMGPSTQWLMNEEGGPKELREGLDGAGEIYQDRAHVLRALADAAADDPEVEAAYSHLVNSFRDLISKKIEGEIAAGRTPQMNAPEVACALIWTAERYLYLSFAPGQTVDGSTVAETIALVFSRTIYGSD